MKKRVISMLLCLVMLLSACALCFTGCGQEEEEENKSTTTKNEAATLVMWCVTEEGTDDEQAQAVAKEMAEYTKSKCTADLIVKYLTLAEYYEKLEEAFEWQVAEAERKKEEEAANKNNNKNDNDKEEKPEEPEEEPEEEDMYDEDGNLIVDKTKYPELTEEEMLYQVDILYLSGYDKYTEYIANEWLASLNSSLNAAAKELTSFVSPSLLSAVRYKNTTYAIPNNNVIGEYTYMLIDKELFKKYYYTASIDDVHSIVDIAPFLEDIHEYEPDVLPIDGKLEDCMELIAHYWDIDPNTGNVTGDFSVLGYAYEPTDSINRGQIALKFESLLTNDTYKNALLNLKEFDFKGYFGTPEEGQRSAVTFVTGDASMVSAYEDAYHVVVVDYPRAADEDIYGNMLAVSAYSSDLDRSMKVITLLNTDVYFRNLFLYGIEGVNYTRDSDGFVTMTRNNKYNMDITKTGNEFLAYLPEGTDPAVWESAKKQNREALVDPLLGFDYKAELIDESDILEEDNAWYDVWQTWYADYGSKWDTLSTQEKKDNSEPKKSGETSYVIEVLDSSLMKYVADLSDTVWKEIQACKTIEALEKLIDGYQIKLDAAMDPKLRMATSFETLEQEFDKEGNVVRDEDGVATVPDPTVDVKCTLASRTSTEKTDDGVTDVQEIYYTYNKKLNFYQLYYRWMTNYGYLPAGFGG